LDEVGDVENRAYAVGFVHSLGVRRHFICGLLTNWRCFLG